MIKHIFFDADGMVINKPRRFSEVLASDYGITTETTDEYFKNDFILAETGQADLKDQLPKYLAKWGWQKSLEEFLEYWFESENYVDERLVVDIKGLRAHGLKCHLVTNQEKHRVEFMRKSMGLGLLFDQIFVSCELGYMKPTSEFWSAIDGSLGNLNKDEVLVWDDKEKCVTGAKDFGFNAELYKNFESYQKILENYL